MVLGVAAGVSSGLLSVFLSAVERLFMGFTESNAMPGPFTVPAWRRALSLIVGGLVASLIWWLLRNRTTRVPSVEQAVRDAPAGGHMPVWQTAVHVLTQMFLVGTGASIGREVAPREAGSMLAGAWTTLLSRFNILTADDRRLLVAAAAGAGFAGVYISPLTGMFFSVEILLRTINVKTVSVSLAMSAIATLIGGAIKDTEPYYLVGSETFAPAFALLAGPLSGLAGAWFGRLASLAKRRQTTGVHILWQLPAVAALTAGVAVWAPQVMGNGRPMAQFAMAQSSDMHVLMPLLGLIAAKALLTVLTIRAGASGGTLTPSIALGAALGAMLGVLWHLIIPTAPIWQCAMIGATGLLAASQHAPLMALMMLMEISHLPLSALAPLGIGVAMAMGAAALWGPGDAS